MKSAQIKGIVILLLSVLAYLLLEDNITKIIAGILCAIGLGYILKWIPFKKQNLSE